MEEALRRVELYDTVMEKGGLQMKLSEKASNLSGGQRQRLALARALLHDSDIYIFDEATSNIDVESENKIMEVVTELAHEKTVLLISHRLANVTGADAVFVLKEKQGLTESGTDTFSYGSRRRICVALSGTAGIRAVCREMRRNGGTVEMNNENRKTGIGGQRNGIQVMAGLVGMIKPLLPVMLLAVVMGCVGNLTATFLTVLGGYGLLAAAGLWEGNLTVIFGGMILCALLRGILRYAEQASNHYIAFKLLARIRHQVFAALRRLAPAKLDGSGKGNLISVITSDIELLEVFYAHTISPIAIAVVTSVIMAVFIGTLHPLAGALAALF